MVDSLPQECPRGTFHPTATFGRPASLGPAIYAPAMKYDELIIFLSCHGMEDFPLYCTGEEAQGLLACYTAALPFALNMLIANALFSTALFGLLAQAERRYPELAAQAISVER